MKSLKDILKLPIKETVLLLRISLAVFITFQILWVFVDKMPASNYIQSDETGFILRIVRYLLLQFVFISKFALDFSIVLLASQLLYRYLSARRAT